MLKEDCFNRVFGSVVVLRNVKKSGQAVSLMTLKGDFTLSGPSAADMAELITMFVSGLTERSQYAVALKEVEKQGQCPTSSSFEVISPDY